MAIPRQYINWTVYGVFASEDEITEAAFLKTGMPIDKVGQMTEEMIKNNLDYHSESISKDDFKTKPQADATIRLCLSGLPFCSPNLPASSCGFLVNGRPLPKQTKVQELWFRQFWQFRPAPFLASATFSRALTNVPLYM